VAEFLRVLLDILYALCPFRVVWQWQQGVYFFCGRSQGAVGPGLKLVFPGLCEVRTVSVVPEIYTTPLQTVTLRDKSTLTYSASITVVVRNAERAYTTLGHYAETVVELAARVLSDELADADPERFDPARKKRERLLSEMREAVNRECAAYGLEVTALGLNNFVRGIRTIRLLTDRSVLSGEPVALQ
jgi:regulator of protease activity HflC (stomatin/prohibitin superfamily)